MHIFTILSYHPQRNVQNAKPILFKKQIKTHQKWLFNATNVIYIDLGCLAPTIEDKQLYPLSYVGCYTQACLNFDDVLPKPPLKKGYRCAIKSPPVFREELIRVKLRQVVWHRNRTAHISRMLRTAVSIVTCTNIWSQPALCGKWTAIMTIGIRINSLLVRMCLENSVTFKVFVHIWSM